MRRAILTNRPFGGPPFTLGDPAISRTFGYGTANTLIVNLHNPAPRDGVVGSASIYMTGAGTGRFVTGTYVGSTFTVSAVDSSDRTLAVGLNTFSTSLAIPSGGYIALWKPSGTLSRETSGGSSVTFSAATAPTVGQTYSATSIASLFSLEGTGS